MSSSASRVWMITGQTELARERHLLGKHRPLHVARREVVVVVEADLARRRAPADWPAHAARTSAAARPALRRLVRLVRMHADRKPRPCELRGHALPPAPASPASPAARMQSTCVSPASRTRASTSSRSGANTGSARWQWESITPLTVDRYTVDRYR